LETIGADAARPIALGARAGVPVAEAVIEPASSLLELSAPAVVGGWTVCERSTLTRGEGNPVNAY
jgi:hypothetical protein